MAAVDPVKQACGNSRDGLMPITGLGCPQFELVNIWLPSSMGTVAGGYDTGGGALW